MKNVLGNTEFYQDVLKNRDEVTRFLNEQKLFDSFAAKVREVEDYTHYAYSADQVRSFYSDMTAVVGSCIAVPTAKFDDESEDINLVWYFDDYDKHLSVTFDGTPRVYRDGRNVFMYYGERIAGISWSEHHKLGSLFSERVCDVLQQLEG